MAVYQTAYKAEEKYVCFRSIALDSVATWPFQFSFITLFKYQIEQEVQAYVIDISKIFEQNLFS